MRHIKLVLDDKKFIELERIKDGFENKIGEKINWERFVWEQIVLKK